MIALDSQLAHLALSFQLCRQNWSQMLLIRHPWLTVWVGKYVHMLSAVLADAGLHHSASCQQYR